MKEELLKRWGEWDLGGKLIAASVVAAFFSMFLNWFDSGLAQGNGFRTSMFIFLALWIYPALKLWNKSVIDKRIGIALAVIGMFFVFSYISDQSHELFGRTMNFAGPGAYIFILASASLAVGVFLHNPSFIDGEQNDIKKDPELERVLAEEHETTDSWPTTLILKYTFLPKPAGAPKMGKKEMYVRGGVAGAILILMLVIF